MYLGIEIGGTKLQLGAGTAGGAAFADFRRFPVDAEQGADGIRRYILSAAREMLRRFPGIRGVGIGFGGPVDATTGQILKSHHVAGWDGFPLQAWIQSELGIGAVVGNDCDVAALAEALLGAGRGRGVVMYVTVGTGIGGGLVIHGKSFVGSGQGAVELGHLRPSPNATSPADIVESVAAGWGIGKRLQEAVLRTLQRDATHAAAGELLEMANGKLDRLAAEHAFGALEKGNDVARDVVNEALRMLGWAVAQCVTITGPDVVVVGGGVSLAGEERFFRPLREWVAAYVFPPFRDRLLLVPAELGEEVVVHGALLLAQRGVSQRPGATPT